MLLRLESSDEGFRGVTFRRGFNLLVAERTMESTSTDTRNSVGKSSLVELLHFMLGAKADRSSFMGKKDLAGMRFTLEMDWPQVVLPILVSRATTRRSGRGAAKEPEILVEPDVISPPARRRGELFDRPSIGATLLQWQAAIERDLFRLPAEHKGLSGRTLLSFYMRRIGDHAFNEPTRTFPQQSLAEGTANLSYLLGLDWGLATRYRDIANREGMRRKLRDAAKDPVFGKIVGRASELRGQITVRENALRALKQQIDSFVIVPGFEELQAQADRYERDIARSRALDAADRKNIQDIEEALASSGDSDPVYLEAAYAELGELVGDRIRRRLDEVRDFHASVISNRRRHLEDELRETRERLERRLREREDWGQSQSAVLRSLEQGGALQSLLRLQERYAQESAELAALRNRFEAADTLESSRAEIAQERAGLQRNITLDLRDRRDAVDEATLLYSRYASRLYGERYPAYLEFSADASNLRITPRIESDEGRGVGNMAMFCFDLTVAVIAARNGRGPDFLVHDSHLFDGVDERQIQRALILASEVCLSEGIQYVATMNSDDLDKARRTGSDDEGAIIDAAIISPRLTDASAQGGLFGFRF